MDHPDGSPPPGPSPPSAASPTHHTTTASPPLSNSDGPTSLSSPRFVLYLGCDYSEGEDDEEELRNVKETTEEDLIPPALPELKLSALFSLTPVLTRKPSEGSRQPHDLVTPYHSTSTSDCPERPSKTHQSSASHCETSTSCRLLFSEAASRLCSEASTRKDDFNDHHLLPVLPVTTKQSTPPPMEVEGTPSPPPSSTPITQSHGFKGDGEELPTPIHSPSSSSSSCSDCVACSSDSCSLEIATPYLLSPPILPLFKLTSRTIISSEEDINQEQAVNKALDPPLPPCEFNDMPQEGENVDVENLIPQNIPQESLKDAMDDSEEEEVVVQKVKDPPLSALEGLREVCAAALRLQHEHLDTSLTPSSAGSVRSNWTVMSGISPLPSSDPTHLRYHHHRHHDHHHHHHHGHHRHHHKHHLSNNEDNMVTSTPIHQRHVPQGVNVSAVTSSPEVFSDPRFIMSSELGSSEFQSDMTGGAVGEGGGVVMPSASSGSDKENIEGCPAPVTLPEPLQSTSIKTVSGFIQTDRSGTDKRRDIQTGVESAGLETSRQHTNGENNDNNEGDEEGTNNEMQQISDTSSRKKREREDEREVLNRDIRQQSLCRPLFCSPYAQGRPLSKAEVRAMASAHVNFSEKYLFPEDVPSPRHCSTMDDSLFRAVTLDSPMSVSMD